MRAMASTDPFESASRRIASAKRHITNVERELRALAAESPHVIVSEPDTEPGWTVLKVKMTKKFPATVEDGVFDALINLRSALDNATYATCILRPGSKKNPRKTNFPFGLDEANARSMATGNSRDIPKEIFDYCMSFKPYKGGNDLLWALNNTSNINKHRLIAPASSRRWQQLSLAQYTLTKFVDGAFKWDSTKNEMPLFAIPTPETANYKIQIGLIVAFGDVEIVEGKDVLTTLDAMATEVAGIVGAIEAEAKRVGLLT